MTVPFADVDAKVGGYYRIQMKNSDDETFTTTGQYQEIVPNENWSLLGVGKVLIVMSRLSRLSYVIKIQVLRCC